MKYSCWLLLGVVSLASAFFTTLYSLELSKDQATSWVISMLLSVLQDIFVSQPIKVLKNGMGHYNCRKLEKLRPSV